MSADVLISGAGPTGLAAGLFLAEVGRTARIVERRTERPLMSKAFGVNARTLALLEPSGVTDSLLAAGWRATAFNLWRNGRRLLRLDLASVDSRFPFMLILPQSETERHLEEAAVAKGVVVEHGTELVEYRADAACAHVGLTGEDGERESLVTSRVLAADGAHSTLREAAGLSFDGTQLPEAWKLFDLRLDVPLSDHEAHVLLLDRGGMFVLRLYDDVWRVIGRHDDPLSQLPKGTRTGEIVWRSDFHIAHRVVGAFARGPLCLAGDAAHVHSPVGGRGMNLGIEDAWVFAQLAAADRLDDYDRLRRRAVTPVVRRVKQLTTMARGESFLARTVRRLPFLVRMAGPFLRGTLARWVLGLDHEAAIR